MSGSDGERRSGRAGLLHDLRPAVAARAIGEPGILPALRRRARVAPPHSIQYTWALVVAAAICYIPANVLPVLSTTALGSTESDTIMGGVIFLYESGSWPLALIVLVASVMIPLGKLVALGYLLVTVQRGSVENSHHRTRIYELVEFVGRWSMLDVFVDAFVVALVQLQPLMSVEPGLGVVFFMLVVVLTMLAAQSFDPRLIWDAASKRQVHMAEPGDLDGLPQATVVPPKRGRISVIWIIPILAALVAIGIAVQRIRSEGPTIEIVFSAAEGIEAGKTLVKYKDVNIGRVTKVELTDDFAKVRVTAKIAKHAAGLMVEDAKFWIVQPTVSLSGVSGLSTLLSGNYIGFGPGKSTESQDSFTGLDVAPVITDERGSQFVLKANDLGSAGDRLADLLSASAGRPGHCLRARPRWQHGPDEDIHQGALRYVRVSRDALLERERSGRVGRCGRCQRAHRIAGGAAHRRSRFRHSTVRACVRARRGEHASSRSINDRTAAMKAPDAVAKRYVLYFKESLRGLAVGAPVTFLGLPAGEVTSVGLEFDAAKADVRPRVVITYFPERLLTYANVKGGCARFCRRIVG